MCHRIAGGLFSGHKKRVVSALQKGSADTTRLYFTFTFSKMHKTKMES